MFRRSPVSALVLSLVLITMAWLGGCAEDPRDGSIAGPDKAYLGNQPDPESLVDTRILNGELDEEFPEDQQVYPYYVVRHGPEAGIYSFADGDTVPDGAYVVLKARATTEEPSPQRFNIQGMFNAGARIRGDGVWFSFNSTYSRADLKPGWNTPHRGLAADTLGFEAGPFRYAVAMRGILNLGDGEVYRDASPDTLTFWGNYPPCVQCVELGNIDFAPTYQYEDPCNSQDCLEERPVLEVFSQTDPRYQDPHPRNLRQLPMVGNMMWVQPSTGRIAFEEPYDPTAWQVIPATYYSYLVYLHGKDHPREHWPDQPAPGRGPHERIKAWRYQIDYEQDLANVIRDGGGTDDIDILSGFSMFDNQPDPLVSDLYILETAPDPQNYPGTPGAWATRVTVGVPSFLLLQGRDLYWTYLRALFMASPPPPPGSPEEEILAWQAEPATRSAHAAWKLSTMQFSPGRIRVVAADAGRCEWRPLTNGYHYYQGTRIPSPNGRSCEDGAYDDPQNGIVEISTIDLEDFVRYSDGGDPKLKEFEIALYPAGAADPFEAGEDPPGWIAGGARSLSTHVSRR